MAGRIRSVLACSVATTMALVGCSLIVPSEVPEYRCSGVDPTSCPSGLVCDTTRLLCVPPATQPDGSDDDVPIDEDAGTDAGADSDAPSGPSPLGGHCVVDGDCRSGLLCGTSTILTTAIVPANSKPICTKPCCTSAECGAGFVCFAGGTGGNYCVSADRADRSPPSTGGRVGGQACTTHTQCRSGLCTGGRCVDTCCEPSQCASGSTCRVGTVDAHTAWICAAPNGGSAKDLTLQCSGNADCKNDNCVQPFSANTRCTPTCCSAADCTALGFTNNVCAYGGAGNDQLKWCYEPNVSRGARDLGATCTDNGQCKSRYCDSELGRCATVCCTSADCASDETCRPSPVGTPFLRCVKDR